MQPLSLSRNGIVLAKRVCDENDGVKIPEEQILALSPSEGTGRKTLAALRALGVVNQSGLLTELGRA